MGNAIMAEELREKIRVIVADVLEVEVSELADGKSFTDDFGADSLLVIDIFARLERDLAIKIAKEDLVEMDNLPTAYALVARNSPQETVSA
jgi:acyl carrier protein